MADIEKKGVALEQLQTFKNFLDQEHNSLQEQIDNKQARLISGENLKTINGQSLLGSGDISTTAQTVTYSPLSFELDFTNNIFNVTFDFSIVSEILHLSASQIALGTVYVEGHQTNALCFDHATTIDDDGASIVNYTALVKHDNKFYELTLSFFTRDNSSTSSIVPVGGSADITYATIEDIDDMFLETFFVYDNHSSYIEITNWDFHVREESAYEQNFNIYAEPQIFDRDNSFVHMDGEDITSEVLSYGDKYGKIYIPSVTGDISYQLYSKLDTENYYSIQWDLNYGVHAETPIDYAHKNEDLTITLIPELPYTTVNAIVYDEHGNDLGVTFVDGVATFNNNVNIRIWAQGDTQVNCWNISGSYNGVANNNDAYLVRADIPTSYTAHLYSNYDDNRKAVEAQILMDNGGNGIYEDITSTAYNPYSQDIDINEVTGNLQINANAVVARNVTLYESYTPAHYDDCPGAFLNANLPLHVRCSDSEIPMQATVSINGSQWSFSSSQVDGTNLLEFTISTNDLDLADPDRVHEISIEIATYEGRPIRYINYETKSPSISYYNPVYKVLDGYDLNVEARTEPNTGLNCYIEVYRYDTDGN